MSENNSHDREERQIEAMLHSLDGDAAHSAEALSARDAMLAKLREASLAEFTNSVEDTKDMNMAAQATTAPPAIGSTPSAPRAFDRSRDSRHSASKHANVRSDRLLFGVATRAVALLAAMAALLIAWFNFGPSNAVGSATPFSEVLANLRTSHTLELKVTKDGQASQVWVRAPGLVRWEDSPTKYRIAAGSRLWEIDETTNTAVERDSPWFLEADRHVDLLGLLNVGIRDAQPLLDARPVEEARYAGRDCLVYRVDLPTAGRRIEIEAFADASTKQLAAIVAWPRGERRAGAPLAELELIAVNAPVDEDKFVVAKTLTEDGRIGKVALAQGVVTLRPMLAQRWTPVCGDLLLSIGDWVRTDIRGPNAVRLALSSQVELTLGPGSQIELVSPTQARLHSGEVQVNSPAEVTFELLAPRTGSQKVTAAKQIWHVAADDKGVEQLAATKSTPQWLAGFEGTSNNESLGSLVVTLPDGRNEPLSVGYHKVSVEIRDQIARTTIEESFVNNTPSRLEGVFHFPLPQDASISDFGMWIGNDLVEADVVEKQRAREIYETILRERRDPGLLEWTAGNLFKARVFPIEPNSEKRIKIVYTQVLPLRGGKYRYAYGLRSDLLRTKPVRELSLMVTVNSALPLTNVTCPTHTARIQKTEHSGRVEFAAQEYAPDRDFEVVCEVGRQNSDVVVIPHRRGDDGYLLMQLTPPGGEGQWQRETVPNGKPLNLVLLCDTSASMDREKRKQQAEFVATMLASLGENDRFLIAASDVETAWLTKEPLAPNVENREKAAKFLSDRVSLGWTNLEQAFAAVVEHTPADAQVVYIGDGIVSAGERDPAAFVMRLARLLQPKSTDGADEAASNTVKKPARAFHAVTVGNVYEAIVLRGIAGFGGSVRSILGEQTPPMIAFELLGEMTQDAVRDLKVEFRGVKVAALYPDRLPNLPVGAQQILLARYLPTGSDQTGEVIVTGTRGGEPVRFAARVSFKDAEEGNSFIPRLWARGHLDHLLAQGQTPAIRDEIIALSEEFHIITPYTSLLVLETDADRERFGVKKRFNMRDGERFFAEGKDTAQFELMQQQMARAGEWRLDMRRQILKRLSALGRNTRAMQQRRQLIDELRRSGVAGNGPYIINASVARPASGFYTVGGLAPLTDENIGGFGGIGGGGGGSPYDDFFIADAAPGRSYALKDNLSDVADKRELDEKSDESLSLGVKLQEAAREDLASEFAEFDSLDGAKAKSLNSVGRYKRDESVMWDAEAGESDFELAKMLSGKPKGMSLAAQPYGGRGPGPGYLGRDYYGYTHYIQWVSTLFPGLDGPRPPAKAVVPPTWPADAVALADSIMRWPALGRIDGGLELRRITKSVDPRWNRPSASGVELALYSPQSWLTRPLAGESQVIVNFCDAKERGVYSLPLLLGRIRPSNAEDLQNAPLPLSDLSLAPLYVSYSGYRARVEAAGEGQSLLVLSAGEEEGGYELRLLIDTIKHVVVKMESCSEGAVTGTTEFSNFVEVAGTWWAQSQTSTDAKGGQNSNIAIEVKPLSAAAFAERMTTELAAKPKVQFVKQPFTSLAKARARIASGAADFDDRIVLVMHYAMLQQWDDLLKELDATEKAATGKPGIKWLRTVLLSTMRHNEEARQRLIEEAKLLAAASVEHDYYLAEFVYGLASAVSSPAELLDILTILKPVYDRQPEEPGPSQSAKAQWQERLTASYDALGRSKEALEIRKALAAATPWDMSRQIDVARRLMADGQSDAAYAWLQKELDREIERDPYEDESLRSAMSELYRGQLRWAELLKYTTAWIARNPTYSSAYQHHLSALVYNDRLEEAIALAIAWLREAQVEGKMPTELRARLDAAIGFSQGYSHYVSFNQIDERLYEPLAQAARFFVRRDQHLDIAQRIADYRLLESDVGDRLRGDFLVWLRKDVAKLSPRQSSALVNWTMSGRIEVAEPIAGRRQLLATEVPVEIWQQIAGELRTRWAATEKVTDKHTLGDVLITIYSNRIDDLLLPFERERIAAAPPERKHIYVGSLFERLLSRPWSEAIEEEAFALLTQLTPEQEPVDRTSFHIAALHRLVDAMIANRQVQAKKQLADAGKLNELKRAELAAKTRDFLKDARSGVAARLAAEAVKHAAELRKWFDIERAYLDIKLEQNLPQAAEQAWTILGEVPLKPEAQGNEAVIDWSDPKTRQAAMDAALRERALAIVLNLSVRKSAAKELVNRTLKYLDAGIALSGEVGAAWRVVKFEVMIALDRPDELEKELREEIRVETANGSWRKALALLSAERGKLDEAITLFEGLEKEKLLAAGDYRLLSAWYLTVNRRDAHERAKIESYKQMPEQVLANSLYQLRTRWYRTDLPLPSSFDEPSLLTMKALFEKSSHPENYLYYLRDLYAASRDFRLLQMLPDAVLGRSPQQIYPYLERVNSHVLVEVQSEATADEILARIKKLRTDKLTTTDARALDLFEALIERRSSEVLNQPGPHAEASLAALRRAFDRKWTDGEPVLMAGFLHSLGTLRDPRLVEEQLRELRSLREAAPAKSRDHLLITEWLCKLFFHAYGKQDEGLQTLEAEMRDYLQAQTGPLAGVFPHQDYQVLGTYISMLESVRRFAAAETYLAARMAKPEHETQRTWLEDRTTETYNAALEAGGEVSLGKGNDLLRGLFARGQQLLAAAKDDNVRSAAASRIVRTLEIGREKKLAATAELVRTYAFTTLPATLKQQYSNYSTLARGPLTVITEVLGATEALRYLVERLEQYPQRLDVTWESGWYTFGDDVARLRVAAAGDRQGSEPLEPRILALATKQLRRDLLFGNANRQALYHRSYSNNAEYFWAAKEDDFARVAEQAYAERKTSGRRIRVIAEYLRWGLRRGPRAIEMMLVAHRDGVLDESNQQTLVEWLQQDNRHAESIPLLEGLVASRPDAMNFRTMLLVAYHRSQRTAQLTKLVKATDAHFHAGGRWTVGNIADLGKTVLACGLPEQAIGYLKEAIALHQRDETRPAMDDGVLSDLYMHLAQAHSRLNQTAEAVEAAMGAIICWGPQHNQRTNALRSLTNALEAAKDLAAYVVLLDAETEKSGRDNPILRKALGQDFQRRGDYAAAITQYRLALLTQPNDKETHEGLIMSLDAVGKKDEATRQLLALLDLQAHDLALFSQLVQRFAEVPAEAERAATSLVEAAPNEAENHQALAELREKQNRWTDAMTHWREVAELRRLEPTGLLRLAKAQVHEKQWEAAAESINKLRKTEWPARFGQVVSEAQQLERQLLDSKGR
jgi:ferritin-like metal-binding protein YciE